MNSPFVSVTVCQPGTTVCATIDHVLVDTGSFGLRLDASAVPSTVVLPRIAAPSGGSMGECAQFAIGFAWGSVRTADVTIAGERASAIPIQLVNDPGAGFATPPTSCSNTGRNSGVSVAGANGILGVGLLAQDCGSACTSNPPPAVYYACSAVGLPALDGADRLAGGESRGRFCHRQQRRGDRAAGACRPGARRR